MKLKQIIVFPILLAGVCSALFVAGKFLTDKHAWIAIHASTALPDAREEYGKLMKPFLQPGVDISLSGHIKLYDGEHPEILKETSQFTFVRSGRSFYSAMASQRSVCNGQILVQLDTAHEFIMATALPKDQPDPYAGQGIEGIMGKVFSDTGSFRTNATISGDDRERILEIKSDLNPAMQLFRLRYSPVNYSLLGAEFRFWKEGHRPAGTGDLSANVWITYIDYNKDIPVHMDVDSIMKSILVIHGKHIKTTEAYKDYRIVAK